MASSGLQWPRRSDPMWSGPPFVGSRSKSCKCTFAPRGHLHGVSLSPNFHMFNDLQQPPMASEVGSDVIRSPICGVKEQKLLVHFCSQRPPSWCFSTLSLAEEPQEQDPWQFIGLRGTQATRGSLNHEIRTKICLTAKLWKIPPKFDLLVDNFLRWAILYLLIKGLRGL